MKPLEVAFCGPLKTVFWKECDLFIKSHVLPSGIMPIVPTVFGEENFLASDYLLGTKNDTVTAMNDSTAKRMNQDQATPTGTSV
ncbi:hypothetical protein ILUMI_16002 [Ignelater luminosus]|uniref:Uncharacterized protein n=1 Tax=Ignelater luminosus TaxID=2038154 RepID=A0A8K0CS08_IGNLU|nr:hypothetical protein ILUMI_16002 [Ignelater luminosus]